MPEKILLSDFISRARAYLQLHLPQQSKQLGNEELGTLIGYGVRAGNGWGLTLESDLIRYVTLSLALGADFERAAPYAWAQEIFADKSLTGTQKVDRVILRLQSQLQPSKP